MVTLNKPAGGDPDWYQEITDDWTTLEKVTRYDAQPTTQTVGNTTTETTIYSKSVSAGDMGADGMLRHWMNHRFAHSSGGTIVLTLRVKFGGTTVAVFTMSVMSGASNFLRALLEVTVANKAANSQRINVHHVVRTTLEADSSTPFTEPSASGANDRVINSSSIDTTSAQTLEVTAQWASNPTRNPSVEMLYATLELVK